MRDYFAPRRDAPTPRDPFTIYDPPAARAWRTFVVTCFALLNLAAGLILCYCAWDAFR